MSISVFAMDSEKYNVQIIQPVPASKCRQCRVDQRKCFNVGITEIISYYKFLAQKLNNPKKKNLLSTTTGNVPHIPETVRCLLRIDTFIAQQLFENFSPNSIFSQENRKDIEDFCISCMYSVQYSIAQHLWTIDKKGCIDKRAFKGQIQLLQNKLEGHINSIPYCYRENIERMLVDGELDYKNGTHKLTYELDSRGNKLTILLNAQRATFAKLISESSIKVLNVIKYLLTRAPMEVRKYIRNDVEMRLKRFKETSMTQETVNLKRMSLLYSWALTMCYEIPQNIKDQLKSIKHEYMESASKVFQRIELMLINNALDRVIAKIMHIYILDTMPHDMAFNKKK